MALLFLPIWFNLTDLYEWARPEAAAKEAIHSKAAFLNVPFFTVRAVLYFAIWGTLITILTRWSRQQDEQPPMPIGPMDRRFRLVPAPASCFA
jgi:hypothetical protein